MTTSIAVTDLTLRPPRGFRVRIGGLVILARMLDKGRATLAGKNGQYEYLISIDEHLVRFLGFDPDALLKELATGKGDWEILQWIQGNSKTPRQHWEIELFPRPWNGTHQTAILKRSPSLPIILRISRWDGKISRPGSRFWNSTTTSVTEEMPNDLKLEKAPSSSG
jgi:hypothetical protein